MDKRIYFRREAVNAYFHAQQQQQQEVGVALLLPVLSLFYLLSIPSCNFKASLRRDMIIELFTF